mmetsp:Transcript_2580/g.9870  ORF Transcript_2580/g.9870 Transcript_2580/m.9870 type:complete len:434 (-) Transcript_2580:352-1653(-)
MSNKPSSFTLPTDFETVRSKNHVRKTTYSVSTTKSDAEKPTKSPSQTRPIHKRMTNHQSPSVLITNKDIESTKANILKGADGAVQRPASMNRDVQQQRDNASTKATNHTQKSSSSASSTTSPSNDDQTQFQTHLKTLMHLLKTNDIEKMIWEASKEHKYNESLVSTYFHKKVVVITGASKGLGKHLALLLSKYKTKLVLCARGMEELYKTRKECLALGADEVLVVGCDVTVEVQCKRVIDAAINRFGRIDVLLLNVGVSGNQLFSDMKDLSVFHRMFKTNTMGYIHFVHHALPHLRRQDEARIAVISSMSGKIGVPYRSAYCTSKYAVQGFFEVLRNELKADSKSNIHVTVCSPGWIETQIAESYLMNDAKSQRNHYKLTVDECAKGVMHAIAAKIREERFQMLYRMLPFIGSVSPDYVDQVALKAVGLSAKM